MNIIENKTGKNVDDVICISKRDGNKKRPYLILNKLQAKYIPTKPYEALNMFDKLADEIKLNGNEHVAVVGFAETATAIGAEVATRLSYKYPKMKVTFIPTTREVYDIDEKIEFTEDHSHAVEQILYMNKELLNSIDYIIFAEDEVTTGNTICHCVTQLKEITKAKYMVASLMNCMDADEMKKFAGLGIEAYWLIKTDKEGFDSYTLEYDSCDKYEKVNVKNRFENDIDGDMTFLEYAKYWIKNPRLGTDAREYVASCKKLSETILKVYNDRLNERTKILCLGTEECMYPAIILADILEKSGKDAYVQATTRVPTCVHNEEETTLESRYEIESLYGNRLNYIYNLNEYDFVFIVTDGKILPEKLLEVLRFKGNDKVSVIFI